MPTHPTRLRPRLVVWSSFLALACVATAEASVLYRLDRGATFQDGCFPPCKCPLMEQLPLEDTLELALLGVGDVFDFYDVTSVRWTASGQEVEHSIRGAGTYKVSTIAELNEMSLDLAVDQNLPASFTSDTVPPGAVFPDVDVTISKNGGFCLDTVMEVRARPTPRLEVGPQRLGWDSGLEVVGYDVVKGSLSVLRASGGKFALATDACLADDLHASTLPFATNPGRSDGFYFLVRAGSSTYDTLLPSQVRSRDPGIAASSGACP